MFIDCLQGTDHFRSYREEERKEKWWSPFSGHTSTLCETDREGMHICCGSKEAGVTVWVRARGGAGKPSEERRRLRWVVKDKEHEGLTEGVQNEENLGRDKNGGTNGLARLGELRGVHFAKINGAEWELRRPGSPMGFTSEILCPVESGKLGWEVEDFE